MTILDFPCGSIVITRVLTRGRQEDQSSRRWADRSKRLEWYEEGVMSPRTQVASRSWKRPQEGFSSEAFGEKAALLIPILGFQPPKVKECEFVLLKATKSVTICYSSDKKLMQSLNTIMSYRRTLSPQGDMAGHRQPLSLAFQDDMAPCFALTSVTVLHSMRTCHGVKSLGKWAPPGAAFL